MAALPKPALPRKARKGGDGPTLSRHQPVSSPLLVLVETRGSPTMPDPGFAGFDFLIGDWTIDNEFLKHRHVGSTEGEHFQSPSRCERIMDGHANLEQIWLPARAFTGMALRLYAPATQLWSICWSDTKSFRLFPPTIGRFGDGDTGE